jgi:hypothetical protein
MSTSTAISSAEFIPLPTAAPQMRRRVGKSKAAADHPQALESNASESQSVVTDTSIDGEYVEDAAPVKRKVEPISRAVLSNPGTTMQQLHEMAAHELDVLDALNNEGRQVIKTRLMAIWEEMSVRFERGESVNGISGTGGKGMGKYLRSIGVDPAQRRSWKFEIRQQEALRLAQENPPIRAKRTAKKDIIINSETEADLLAKAGIKMAHLLAGDSMTPPQERVNKAGAMAKDILEAIADGQYARLEPLPPHLTQLEAKLVDTASRAHGIVRAVRQGGNVGEAIADFESNAPTAEKLIEYAERTVKPSFADPAPQPSKRCGNGRDYRSMLVDLLDQVETLGPRLPIELHVKCKQFRTSIGLPPNVVSDPNWNTKAEQEEGSPNGWDTQDSVTDWDDASSEEITNSSEVDAIEY